MEVLVVVDNGEVVIGAVVAVVVGICVVENGKVVAEAPVVLTLEVVPVVAVVPVVITVDAVVGSGLTPEFDVVPVEGGVGGEQTELQALIHQNNEEFPGQTIGLFCNSQYFNNVGFVGAETFVNLLSFNSKVTNWSNLFQESGKLPEKLLKLP